MAALFCKVVRSANFATKIASQQRCLYRVQCQGLRTSSIRWSIDDDFNNAKSSLTALKDDPGNDVKLKMYALFKQATEGKNTKPKPGMMDFVGKAKWEAWTGIGDISQDEAKKRYIDIVKDLQAEEGDVADSSSAPGGTNTYQELIVQVDDGACSITLNRPKKYNAITFKMYEEWGQALKQAANDDRVKLVTVTGAGDYYCSGNDLGNFANIPPEGLAHMAENGGKILNRFVRAFIDFPKPLIALVNGPAVGISVTTMGLFDSVLATDKATFHTPFTVLGQSPEGCSTVTFPKMMGYSKANELLLFNRKITAHEACERGLVSQVFPDHTFKQETSKIVADLAKLPRDSLKFSKQAVRDSDRSALLAANDRECDILVGRWQSPECMDAIMNFFAKANK